MCSDRPDSQKTRLVVHQVASWHVLSCTKPKNTYENLETFHSTEQTELAEKLGSEVTGQKKVCCYHYLQHMLVSLSHSLRQVKRLGRYKGVVRLCWGADSLHGQQG